MKVYFFAPPTEDDKMSASLKKIAEVLQREDVNVIKKVGEQVVSLSGDKITKASPEKGILFADTDGFIIEVTNFDNEIPYILAFATLQKKPILALYQKNKDPKGIPTTIIKQAKQNKVRIESYDDDSLPKLIVGFLQKLHKIHLDDQPNIKFTLRVSKRIEKYLHWKTHGTGKSKAEYLRDKIWEQMKNDAEYQKSHK